MSLEVSLLSQIGVREGRALPPVESWSPELSGDMDMVIKSDGAWWHEGSPVRRKELVRLFASIIKREADDYFLVTPVEKWRIVVEDTPLHVLLLDRIGNDLCAVLTNGQQVIVGDDVGLEFSELDGEMLPLLILRGGLTARFIRTSYYALVEYVEFGNDGQAVVRSAGKTFLIPLTD